MFRLEIRCSIFVHEKVDPLPVYKCGIQIVKGNEMGARFYISQLKVVLMYLYIVKVLYKYSFLKEVERTQLLCKIGVEK